MEDLTLFLGCESVADVKARYRDYATLLHPDAGGEAWVFHELQRQYEIAKVECKKATHQQVVETYNRNVERKGRGRKIYINAEKGFALDNLTLPERNIWRSFNEAFKSLGLPPMDAWEFYDWMNAWKEAVARRERAWAEQRRQARGQTKPPQSVAEWIALHGGLDVALAALEDF